MKVQDDLQNQDTDCMAEYKIQVLEIALESWYILPKLFSVYGSLKFNVIHERTISTELCF